MLQHDFADTFFSLNYQKKKKAYISPDTFLNSPLAPESFVFLAMHGILSILHQHQEIVKIGTWTYKLNSIDV